MIKSRCELGSNSAGPSLACPAGLTMKDSGAEMRGSPVPSAGKATLPWKLLPPPPTRMFPVPIDPRGKTQSP